MYRITNLKNIPLVLDMGEGKESIRLSPRETKEVKEVNESIKTSTEWVEVEEIVTKKKEDK